MARTVSDDLAGETLQFSGIATIAWDGGREADGARYAETGTLRRPEGEEYGATRSYLWRPTPNGIEVFFTNGKPFHQIALQGTPQARHFCDPDTYRVTYDFTDWPVWRTTWTVTGPRKDYQMVTTYRPI